MSFVNTVPACESSGSSSSVAVAALGGVLGVVIVTAIAVQVMVIVFFMKKLKRAEKCTTTAAGPLKRYKHLVIKCSLHIFCSHCCFCHLLICRAPPESFETTSNEAYNAVREETGRTDDAYETVMP